MDLQDLRDPNIYMKLSQLIRELTNETNLAVRLAMLNSYPNQDIAELAMAYLQHESMMPDIGVGPPSSPVEGHTSSCPAMHKIAAHILEIPHENRQMLFDAYLREPYTADFPMEQIAVALGLQCPALQL